MSLGQNAAITAVGAYVPDEVLSNADLEQMVDTSDDWIRSRTGISERRILKDHPTSFLAIKAAQNLIERSAIDPKTIDLVIVSTATPDMMIAATAAYVASEIGAMQAFGYDLQAACSGFLYGMSTASAYVSSGRYKRVLLIGADKMSSIIDYKDRTTCIIFGDGAGAALFEPNDEGLGFMDEHFRSDGVGRQHLHVKAGGSMMPASQETTQNGHHYLRQDGKTVFKLAVSNMSDAAINLMDKNNLTANDIDFFVPHQANQRIIDATAQRTGVDPEKVLSNIVKYGNTTAATLPLILSDFEHRFKKGDNVMFAAFGGGFTWGAAWLKWAYNT